MQAQWGTLTEDEEQAVRDGLRMPMGRYTYERASQLSGVPKRTVHHWARTEAWVPDFVDDSPMEWSYRDLVFLRLFAWLRSKRMPLAQVTTRVRFIRTVLEDTDEDIFTVRSDGQAVLLQAELVDRLTGQQAMGIAAAYMSLFDMAEPLEDVGGNARMWGPDLVLPTQETSILATVMSGDPCVRHTRIATSTIHALKTVRHLDTTAIAQLYPGLNKSAVEDAIRLESRLRGGDAALAA